MSIYLKLFRPFPAAPDLVFDAGSCVRILSCGGIEMQRYASENPNLPKMNDGRYWYNGVGYEEMSIFMGDGDTPAIPFKSELAGH